MPIFWLSPLTFWSCFPTLPWLSLAAPHKVQPPVWPSQEPSDLSGLDQNIPLPLQWQLFPLRVSLGRLTHTVVHSLYILHFNSLQFSFLYSIKYLGQTFASVNFQFSNIVKSSYDYYPIVVWLLFSILTLEIGNVFQVLWSHYQQPSTESVNIIQVQDSPTFAVA